MSAIDLKSARRVIADAVRPGHFFAAAPLELVWDHDPAETVFWEEFLGQVLDGAKTRNRKKFESWNVYAVEAGERSDEPVVSVKLEPVAGRVHVCRAILSYAWEAFDDGGAIQSRETTKWLRERVGVIDLERIGGPAELLDELVCQLFQAVVGTSRLPLTSVEAPLPAFSLGRLFYRCREGAGDVPARSVGELIGPGLSPGPCPAEWTKLAEMIIRAVPAETFDDVVGRFARLRDDQSDRWIYPKPYP